MKVNIKKELYSWIVYLLVASLFIFIIRQFIFVPSIVTGVSMVPNLQEHDYVVANKVASINHFDKIIFEAPDTDNQNYIKRVIGLPGDTIEVKNDKLYINGVLEKEPYLKEAKDSLKKNQKLTKSFNLEQLTGKKKVPQDKFFVLGDNRPYSNDSRYYGFVSKESVIGKVQFRIWPLKQIGIPK